jgi:hypothetical protein
MREEEKLRHGVRDELVRSWKAHLLAGVAAISEIFVLEKDRCDADTLAKVA